MRQLAQPLNEFPKGGSGSQNLREGEGRYSRRLGEGMSSLLVSCVFWSNYVKDRR
jgi:hypothetical protein